MAKTPNQNDRLAAEDAEAQSMQRRAEQHQDALAAEEKSIRSARAKLATEGQGDLVLVTVTKFGEGKVSTGEHVPTVGDIMAKKGESLMVSPEVAAELEARGFAELE